MQEKYLLNSILPFVKEKFPAQNNPEGRWLLGFSKSGWGAYTLLMRHPEVFGYAAAWDTPFMINGSNTGKEWGPMGISKNFGTKENLLGYLPTTLASKNKDYLQKHNRLVLGVGKFWKSQCVQMHMLLKKEGIPHIYLPELLVNHRWDTGWFTPVAESLIKIAVNQDNK